MGWLTNRRMQGNRVGGTGGMSMKALGPLRKITGIYSRAESLFDKDFVLFECGHNGTATSGAKRGRCHKCLDDSPKDDVL